MLKNAQTTAQLHSSHMLISKGQNSPSQASTVHELPDVQAGFRKGRGTEDQITNISWIIGKAREFQKNIYFALLTMPKPLTMWTATNWKILTEMGILDHLTCVLRTCMQVRKQQLELDMEQQTGSK